MPGILASCPSAVYVVLGATHPNLLRDQGEAYRERLMIRAHELGVEDRVVFINQFFDQATLLDHLSMCDVYVTPYLNEAQMTSGTLAYSFGLGKAVVSTPYWHAKELLADGRGILVPFGDSKAIGSEISSLLADDARRHSIGERAYAASRSMTWARTAESYLAVFESARSRAAGPATSRGPIRWSPGAGNDRFRKFGLGHFLSLCDEHGHCCSTPSFRWRTAPTAIASTTTRAPCSSRRRCCAVARRHCPRRSRRALRHSFSTRGIRTPAASAIS